MSHRLLVALGRLALGGAVPIAVLLGGPAAAPAGDVPDASMSDDTGAPTFHGRLQLSIEDAIAMGLKNNLDVEVARHDPLLAWEDFRAAWGAYDPELFAEYGYGSRKTPVASSLQASDALLERELDGRAGLRGQVPWLGATYSVAYAGTSLETNSSITTLSPEYTARIVAEATFPLLRDLIWNESWTRIKQGRVGYDISEEEFRRQVMDTVQNIETAYWDLVAAEEQLRVAEKSVETARALLDQTETQYEVGVVSRVEVTEAEAGVAQRQVELIRSRNAYRSSQDVLMNEVLGRGLRPGSRMQIVPTDRPQDYIVYEIDMEEASRKAFENRPELAAAAAEIERRAIEAKFRSNQKLPRLDVVAGYNTAGLAGEANPDRVDFGAGQRQTTQQLNQNLIDPLADSIEALSGPPLNVPGLETPQRLPVSDPPAPPQVDRRYSGTDDDFFSGDTDSWSIRGLFSIPLFNQTARHLAARADVDLRKAYSQLARLRQGIVLSVRRAARDLHSAQEGIEAAERARVAAAEQLRAERIRLEQGESTPFDVLLREEDLVQAESTKINAIRLYRNSAVALDREQGTILKSRNVVIDDVRAMR